MSLREAQKVRRGGEITLIIASKIRQTRRNSGVSQSTLARAVGVSYQQLQKYENGHDRVSSERLQQIAEALNKPITHFYINDRARPTEDITAPASIRQWMKSSRTTRQIVERLPMLTRKDANIVRALLVRLTSVPK